MTLKILCSVFVLMCASDVCAVESILPAFEQKYGPCSTRPISRKFLMSRMVKTKDLLTTHIEEFAPRLGKLTIEGYIGNDVYLVEKLSRLLSQAVNLQVLVLDWNRLRTLPREIGHLTDLRRLDLSVNQLNDLPKELLNLTNLQALILSYNRLGELPKNIGQLSNLCWLCLNDNQLTEIPKEIRNLVNLQMLDLSVNHLTELPKELGHLINLRMLDLRNNHLMTLPKEIGKLMNLKVLDLSDNQLVALPKELGNLINLQVLDLSYNQLIKLPKEMGNLINLCRFTFDDIRIIASIFDLGDDEFRSLSLRRRRLTQIPFDIVEETELEDLDISNNNLEEIPNLIIRCQKLERIDLSGNSKINSIDKVSDGVFGLPQLESLVLTTSNGQQEYDRDGISKIRKQRIQKLRAIVPRETIPSDLEEKLIDNVVFCMNIRKSPENFSNKNLKKVLNDIKEIQQLITRRSFRRQLLNRLEAVEFR